MKQLCALVSGLLFLIASGHPAFTQASDPDAEKIAANWVRSLDAGDAGALYENYASSYYKATVPKKVFVNWVGTTRIQSGGAASSRSVEGFQQLDQLQNGVTGTFYYVRYRSSHPNGNVFDDILLTEENGAWLVYWYTVFPAPPNQ
ncbi:DUF4019 domain-containing protein [Mesorhizobium sp. M0437]|uniref:DUF4019 domain-containing protein n=1 Tax=Mesorhizobium sp. M0437 TaxID=2956945 RepID=UPI00333A7523